MAAIPDNELTQNDELTPGNDDLAKNNEPVLKGESAHMEMAKKHRATEISPLYLGLALVAMWAIGAVGGYLFGLAQARQSTPVQVVVTATPGSNSQPVAQMTQEATQADTSATTATDPNAPPTPTIMEFVLADARHIEGSPDAPVTMIEFSDFKCPYCGRFAAESLERLRKEYVSTGQVRFVYKHYAILGQESSRSAEASECIAEQGKFWEYHDAIFADQATTRSTLDDPRLAELAGQVGVDTTAFEECLASGRYTAQISQQSLSVQALGFRGTPSFLINGVALTGAQPFEVFQQVIEEQLKAVGKAQ